MPSESVDGNDDPDSEPGRRRYIKNRGSPSADSTTNPMSNILNRLKRGKSARTPANLDTGPQAVETQGGQRVTEKISDVTKLFEEMQRLGLEPAGLGKFIASLHKLAVASGVSPENLALVIKEVSELSEGKQMSIAQTKRHIQNLSERQKLLQKE
ncbi:MAG: hypothetical protein ACREAZ_01145, partial [Nitrososphaera sp.]